MRPVVSVDFLPQGRFLAVSSISISDLFLAAENNGVELIDLTCSPWIGQHQLLCFVRSLTHIRRINSFPSGTRLSFDGTWLHCDRSHMICAANLGDNLSRQTMQMMIS